MSGDIIKVSTRMQCSRMETHVNIRALFCRLGSRYPYQLLPTLGYLEVTLERNSVLKLGLVSVSVAAGRWSP